MGMVLNMLIGAQCEVVSTVAKNEKETADITLMKSTMLIMLQDIDKDGSGEIDEEELQSLLIDPQAAKALDALNIDKAHLVAYLEMSFEDIRRSMDMEDGAGPSLTIRYIIETLLQFRGD